MTASRACCLCVNAARLGQRTCRACHAAYMRTYRQREAATRAAEAWELSQLRHRTQSAYAQAVTAGMADDPLLREMRLALLKLRRSLRQADVVDAQQSERRLAAQALRREREAEQKAVRALVWENAELRRCLRAARFAMEARA